MSKKKQKLAAIFVIIIAVVFFLGVIAFFLFHDKDHGINNFCNFGAGFECIDYYLLQSTGTVSFMLKNNYGSEINLNSVKFKNGLFKKIECNEVPKLGKINTNEIRQFTWKGCSFKGFQIGQRGFIELSLILNNNDKLKGELYTIVQ